MVHMHIPSDTVYRLLKHWAWILDLIAMYKIIMSFKHHREMQSHLLLRALNILDRLFHIGSHKSCSF